MSGLPEFAMGRDRAAESPFVKVLRDCATGASAGAGDDGKICIPPAFAIDLSDEIEMLEARADRADRAHAKAQFAIAEAALARRSYERAEVQCVRWTLASLFVLIIGNSQVSWSLWIWGVIQ